MMYLVLTLMLIPSWAFAAFDSSEYRQNTYGAPNHYCDLSLSIAAPSGTGTLGDPWNATRCMTEPVSGDVIGLIPGVSATLAVTASHKDPAFRPTHSGTLSGSTCTANIVYVTKYAAVALDYSTITSNANRTELRRAGTEDAADSVATGANLAGSVYGTYQNDCIIFDGIFVDMAQNPFRNDSGVISARGYETGVETHGIQFRNFVIKGKVTDCDSNCTIWRSDQCTNCTLSNFVVKNFDNQPTGGGLNQDGGFNDDYGAQNVVYEHFLLDTGDLVLYPKGQGFGGAGNYNYVTVQYGIIKGVLGCMRFNDLDPTNTTTVHHVLCQDYRDYGLSLSNETSPPRNFLMHHNTFTGGCTANTNCVGAIYLQDAASISNVEIRDNLVDTEATYGAHSVNGGEATYTFPTANYNGYYEAGGAYTWSYNGVNRTTLASWRTATGQEANSQTFASDPFNNRASDDFTIAAAHAALTASSTGGEVGAYEGSYVIGIDVTAAVTTGGVSGTVSFSGNVRIQ